MVYKLALLRLARERAVLTQAELARLSGIDIRTVQRLESGETMAVAGTLRKLAKALKVKPAELMEDDSR